MRPAFDPIWFFLIINAAILGWLFYVVPDDRNAFDEIAIFFAIGLAMFTLTVHVFIILADYYGHLDP